VDADLDKQKEREDKLSQVYLAIISRYKDYIEEKEGLSVAELPRLVTPSDPKVKEKVDEIKEGFLNYDYLGNFKEASIRAHEFVRDQITEAILPLQFWLTPDETLTFRLGDQMDKNMLLCSIFIGLGNPSAKVFVKISDSARGVFVYFEFKGRIYLFDIEGAVKEFDGKEQMLLGMGLKEETTAYEFNNQMYADIY
jgi:hypothetical protein